MNTVHKNVITIHKFRYLSLMIPIFMLKSDKLSHEVIKQDHGIMNSVHENNHNTSYRFQFIFVIGKHE